jgi:hypothetical protein
MPPDPSRGSHLWWSTQLSQNPRYGLICYHLLSYSPIRGFVYKSVVNFNLQFVRVGCKLQVEKKIVHGVGTEKKNLHITIPEKNSSKSPPPPPPHSKVKWSAPNILFPTFASCINSPECSLSIHRVFIYNIMIGYYS